MARLARVLTWVLPVLALTVIVFGAYVRLTDAGLGCPDWPGCYGHLGVPSGPGDIHLADPDWRYRPLERGKAWREMIHRYLASILGLGIVVLGFLHWRHGGRAGTSDACYVLVPLVVLQGLLGMWTVTLLLKPLVVSAHLLGGLATLALLWWNWLRANASHAITPAPRARVVAWLALAVVVLQIFLGGWTSTNYAALACTDFPTCHGRWWPETEVGEAFVLWRGLGVNYEFGVLDTPARTAIHVAHRVGAVVVTLVLASLATFVLRRHGPRLRALGWGILAALSLQLGLGISNVVAGLPLGVAVAHNGGAALLLVTLVTLVFMTGAERSP